MTIRHPTVTDRPERYPFAYENEDGEVYAPVSEEPDQSDFAQRYANQTGLLVVDEGRRTVKTQDCECVPTGDECPDDPEGGPCVVTERNECWVFTTFENTEPGRRDMQYDLGGEDRRVWEPSR